MADYTVGPEILLTDKIRRWIRTILTTSDIPNDTREQLRKYNIKRRNTEEKKARTIPFQLVKSVHSHIKDGTYLHELLEGSDVHLPTVTPYVRNPELDARIQKLKNQQANREYDDMTKNVNPEKRNQPTSYGEELKSVNNQLIAVFNFILTVGGSFVFAYKATEYALEVPNFAKQLCIGLITATVVFFADLYFLLKNTV